MTEAGRDDVGVRVRNIAVPGWTLWNEYHAVTARLDAGEPPPDMVVFYDGFNDMLFSLEQSVVDDAHVDGVIVNQIDRDPDLATAYRNLPPTRSPAGSTAWAAPRRSVAAPVGGSPNCRALSAPTSCSAAPVSSSCSSPMLLPEAASGGRHGSTPTTSAGTSIRSTA